MEELKAFVEKQPDSWRKQVVVLTVSIDEDKDVVLSHLQRRGWDKFALHAWDEGQRAAQQYGVEASRPRSSSTRRAKWCGRATRSHASRRACCAKSAAKEVRDDNSDRTVRSLTCGLLWAQPSEPTELRVRVVNACGSAADERASVGALAVDFRRLQLLPATEPLMQPVDAQGAARLQWHPAHQATVQEILAGERGGAVVLLVSAPDHVPLYRALTYPIAAEQTVALRAGQTVQVHLKPTLRPPDDFGTRLPFQKPIAWDDAFFASLRSTCSSPRWNRWQTERGSTILRLGYLTPS
jgi:hypothetical protein